MFDEIKDKATDALNAVTGAAADTTNAAADAASDAVTGDETSSDAA